MTTQRPHTGNPRSPFHNSQDPVVRQSGRERTEGTKERPNPATRERTMVIPAARAVRPGPSYGRNTFPVDRLVGRSVAANPQTTRGYLGIRGGGVTTHRPHTGSPRSPHRNSPGLVGKRPGRRRTGEPRNWAIPATRGGTGIIPAAQTVRPELSCGRNRIPADRRPERSTAVYPQATKGYP